MSRIGEPDPMAECRPGGSCTTCNPRPIYCQGCLDVEVENKDDLCDKCAATPVQCAWCGEPIPEGRFCSVDCRRAAEADHA